MGTVACRALGWCCCVRACLLLHAVPVCCCPRPRVGCSIYVKQSGWTLPDHILWSGNMMFPAAVKRVIKGDLLGTYQDFLRR